ncbi:hypothetical protein SAMN06893096_103240 [Geodermatophilus pulveris]|uniref:Uncharacterized protein n=1 Tax=Geodermatophilus pulveris TaxID=1564159 RepID=A0A239DKW9_9ACTN|nr:hypothetical protein [Geodermatophilus pulveris]SNS32849.1 hypothetical protein SAMN06893096_103240 [Geodermatophilus pulveris]
MTDDMTGDEWTAEPVFRVRLEAESPSALRAFLDEVQPDVGCRPVASRSASGFVMDVYLPESRLESARSSRAAPRVSMTVLENATEVGRERQADVGEGNRFAARSEVPRGLGRKE